MANNATQFIGHLNRLRILEVLTRLGYATTRQLALCVYGCCNDTKRKQVSRMLCWLLSRRYVVEKRATDNASGERMVAIIQAGLRLLSEGRGLPSGRKHGRDWLRHAHNHRTAANSIWAACHRGKRVPGWSELEVRGGIAPPELSLFRFRSVEGISHSKVPDLLLTHYSGQRLPGPVWVEVENTYRSSKDLAKLVSFLRAMFHQNCPPIHQVWLVVTANGAKGIGRRLREAMTHGPESGASVLVRNLDAKILTERIGFFVLNHADYALSALYTK